MQDYFKKNPTTVMVLIAMLLVGVGAVSFYLGRSNGIEQSQDSDCTKRNWRDAGRTQARRARSSCASRRRSSKIGRLPV